MNKTEFDDTLLERIQSVVQPGDEILTLAAKRLNLIAAIDRNGIWVQTSRSKSHHAVPKLVPAWMITTAWQQLQKAGVLSNTELLDDLNVKRSSFVIALLAQFPDVVVRSSEPIVVELISVSAT